MKLHHLSVLIYIHLNYRDDHSAYTALTAMYELNVVFLNKI